MTDYILHQIRSEAQEQDAEVAQFIEDAKTALIEKGWCKGSYENSIGQLCMIGATRRTTERWYFGKRPQRWATDMWRLHTRTIQDKAERWLGIMASRLTHGETTSVTEFNDNYLHSAGDATDFLDKALAAWKERPQ